MSNSQISINFAIYGCLAGMFFYYFFSVEKGTECGAIRDFNYPREGSGAIIVSDHFSNLLLLYAII